MAIDPLSPDPSLARNSLSTIRRQLLDLGHRVAFAKDADRHRKTAVLAGIQFLHDVVQINSGVCRLISLAFDNALLMDMMRLDMRQDRLVSRRFVRTGAFFSSYLASFV
jgi:hypothetical protein